MTDVSVDDCAYCEPYTPSGLVDSAGLCPDHACPGCRHWPHDADECGVPDYFTGWCECSTGPVVCPECGRNDQHRHSVLAGGELVGYPVTSGPPGDVDLGTLADAVRANRDVQ